MLRIKNFLQKKRERAYPYIEDYFDGEEQEKFIKNKKMLANKDFKKEINQYNDLIKLFHKYSNSNKVINFKDIYHIIDDDENANEEQSKDIQIKNNDDDLLEYEISTSNQNNVITTTNLKENNENNVYYIKVISEKENKNFLNVKFYGKNFNEVENLLLLKNPIFINKMEYDNILSVEYIQTPKAFLNNEAFLKPKEWKCKIFAKEGTFSLNLNELNPNNIYLFVHQGKFINLSEENLNNYTNQNRYPEEEKLISPETISPFYFNYCSFVDEKSQKDYKFILTNERKTLQNKLENYISIPLTDKFLVICGPKGIGKTSFLLYFCNEYSIFRLLYLNAKTLINASKEKRKIYLEYEFKRLFHDYLDKDNEIIKEIFDKINSLGEEFRLIGFIFYIIEKLKKFIKNEKENMTFPIITIILDQFYPKDDFDLYQLKNELDSFIYIRLIVCLSLGLKKSQNVLINAIKNRFVRTFDPSPYTIALFYISNLISQEGDFIYIIRKENEIFKKDFINKFGIIPYNYYFMKNIENEKNAENLSIIVENDLNAFFGDSIGHDTLNLIGLIKSNFLLNDERFVEILDKLPLKYLNIKKVVIQSDKIDWDNCPIRNQKLLNFYFSREISPPLFLENFFFNLKEAENDIIYHSVKDKLYTSDLIYKIDNLVQFDKPQKNKEITLYKIEFLYPYIEQILIKIIDKELDKNIYFLQKIINDTAFGGYFELIVNYYILSNRKIVDINIKQIKSIDSLVPYNYSIKYISSKRKGGYGKKINYLNDSKKKKYQSKLSLKYEVTFLKQNNFNGRYYDFGILVPIEGTNAKNEFNLIVFHTSIRKPEKKNISNEENELILTEVKNNIEDKYDIQIKDIYFYYILSYNNNNFVDKIISGKFPVKYICFKIDREKRFIYEEKSIINNNGLIINRLRNHN